MIDAFGLLIGTILRLFRACRTMLLENLALRQQLAALKRKRPRSRLVVFDKLFWVLARTFWSGWKQALIVVTPETVVQWHRAGFRLYRKLISRVRRAAGRRQTPDRDRRTSHEAAVITALTTKSGTILLNGLSKDAPLDFSVYLPSRMALLMIMPRA
jgi:hypothetical protein